MEKKELARSLSLFPLGREGEGEEYRPLWKAFGKKRLILPDGFSNGRSGSGLSYNAAQLEEYGKMAPEVLERFCLYPESLRAHVLVIPGPANAYEPIKVHEEYSEFFGGGFESDSEYGRFLNRHLDDRVHYGWKLFFAPPDSYGLPFDEQRKLGIGLMAVANLGEALWLFGLWRLCRGQYPLDEGRYIRVVSKYRKKWLDGTSSERKKEKKIRSARGVLPAYLPIDDLIIEKPVLVGPANGGIRIIEDDGGGRSDTGLLFVEEVIRKI